MMALGHIFFGAGDTVGASAAYNVTRELVYPGKYVESHQLVACLSPRHTHALASCTHHSVPGQGKVVRTSCGPQWPSSQRITIAEDPS
jgi:hypothetical protein